MRSTLSLAFAALLATACSVETSPAARAESTDHESDALIAGRAGVVFTLSNAAAFNEVLAFRRAADGSLQAAARYATAGRGSGDGLGSQGALTLSDDQRFLFAVNAGSNELSVFAVYGEALYLLDTTPTGGERPVSVTAHGGLVYVLHAGAGHNDIRGFALQHDGTLASLAYSTRALSGADVGPAEVSFSPSGRAIVVTEKATNKIDEFRVDARSGLASLAIVHASSGQTPFGFAVTGRGQVIVSEAFGGADDASAVSSYQLDGRAGIATVSASVPDTEGAACWVALARGDRFAYVTNTKSGTISAYTVSTSGALGLVGDGRAADTGAGSKPADVAVSRGDGFLYVLQGGTTSLGVLRIEPTGALTSLPSFAGLPASAAGLVAL